MRKIYFIQKLKLGGRLCGFTIALLLFPGCILMEKKPIPDIVFSNSITLEGVKENSSNINVGDINGDNHLDILMAKGRHWPLDNVVLFGDGKGGFNSKRNVSDKADRTYSAVLFDLDNDSDLDIVVGNDRSDSNMVFYNSGDGNFKKGGTFGKRKWPTRNVYVDYIDGDEFPDVVVANRSVKAKSNYICYGKSGGGFAKKCNAISREPSTTSIAVDINNDGRKDVVVPHRNGGQSHVYLNTGERAFDKRIPFGPSDSAIRSVVSGDFDHDGFVDISIIDQNRGPAVLWGRAEVEFSEPQWLELEGARPNALAFADVNDDDNLDLVIGYANSRSKVFFNNGQRQFIGVAFGDGKGVVYGFAFGDFNEDQLLDVAVARSGAENIVYFGMEY